MKVLVRKGFIFKGELESRHPRQCTGPTSGSIFMDHSVGVEGTYVAIEKESRSAACKQVPSLLSFYLSLFPCLLIFLQSFSPYPMVFS